MGKKVGVAATVFRSSGKTEIWTDSGGGWKKGAEGKNVDGLKPKSGEHEAQLRIDDAPGVEIHCSNVQEIEVVGELLLHLHLQVHIVHFKHLRLISTDIKCLDRDTCQDTLHLICITVAMRHRLLYLKIVVT